MRKKSPHKILFQYFFSYLSTILFATALLALLLVLVALRSVNRMELNTMTTSFEMMANEFQKQEAYFEDSRNRILATSCYHPVILYQSKYRNIELLENFTQYASASPLTNKAFLIYPEMRIIYLTSGKTSYFEYYFTDPIYHVSHDRVENLYHLIQNSREFQIIDMSLFTSRDDLLFVYPLRYLTGAHYVIIHLVFEVNKAALAQHLEQASGGTELNGFRLYYRDAVILEQGQIEGDYTVDRLDTNVTQQKNSTYLFSRSIDEQCQLVASMSVHAFENAVYENRYWLIVGFVMLTVLFLGMSLMIASRNSRQIRMLAKKYGGTNSYNELFLLEDTLQRFEKQSADFINKAKEQLLLQLLQGNATKQMLRHWESLGISMSFTYNCVYVIHCISVSDAWISWIIQEIEAYSNEEIKLYALYLVERSLIAVLASFDTSDLENEISAMLETLVADNQTSTNIQRGKLYDTVFKMPISFNEAIDNLSAAIRGTITKETINSSVESAFDALNEGKCDEAIMLLNKVDYYYRTNSNSWYDLKVARLELFKMMQRFSLSHPQHQLQKKISNLLLLQDFEEYIKEIRQILQEIPNEYNRVLNTDTNADRLLFYISGHISDCDFSLEALADGCGLSGGHASYLIKRATGMAFKEYLTNQRIHYAMKLLIERPDLSINDVSRISGYRTLANFLHKFREITGVTPRQYRERMHDLGD